MHLILANPPWRQLQERAEKIPGDKKHVEGILLQSQCVAQFNTAQNRPPEQVRHAALDFGTRSGENPRQFA